MSMSSPGSPDTGRDVAPARHVEVIGGGPGGMYAARLLKLRRPEWDVRVRERNAPDATFGFGIGLSPATLRRMQVADRTTYDGLLSIGHDQHTWKMRIGTREILGGDNQAIGLERAGLLQVLAEHATDAGVGIVWGSMTRLEQVAGADLVIVAEGASSNARGALAGDLGVTVEAGDLAYIWCGADIQLDTMLFEVIETEHGIFVAHAMPYADGKATFQIDARLDTVRRAGLADASPGADGSDQQALDYLSGIYERVLGGSRLKGNRSVWSTFNTIRCARWSHDNVVLIGDAAHTAHYSVGSGTRMAMEDALALVDAVSHEPDMATALDVYERNRRPVAGRLQDRATRSQEWWTAFPDRVHLPMPQLMVNYQTRTGAVGASGLAATDPVLFDAGLAVLADGAPNRPPDQTTEDAPDRILSCPVEVGGATWPNRTLGFDGGAIAVPADVAEVAAARESQPTQVIVAAVGAGDVVTAEVARKLHGAGADVLNFDAVSYGGDVLRCLDAAERARLLGEVAVAVTGPPSDLDLMTAGVLAGRVDLVSIREGATL